MNNYIFLRSTSIENDYIIGQHIKYLFHRSYKRPNYSDCICMFVGLINEAILLTQHLYYGLLCFPTYVGTYNAVEKGE